MTAPNCPFHGLDSLWIQVAGLSCNLRCAHCFNASGPGNREMPVLRERGIRKPRVKFLPVFRVGREEERSGGYDEDDRVTSEMLELLGPERLLCSAARVATSRGVWVCPILVNERSGRLGDTLEESFRPIPLSYGACATCFRHGAVCANAATAVREE